MTKQVWIVEESIYISDPYAEFDHWKPIAVYEDMQKAFNLLAEKEKIYTKNLYFRVNDYRIETDLS